MHEITHPSSTISAYPTIGKEVPSNFDHVMALVKRDKNNVSQTQSYKEDALSNNLFIIMVNGYFTVFKDEVDLNDLALDSPNTHSEVHLKNENKFLSWFSGKIRSQSTNFEETNPDYWELLQFSKIPTIDWSYRLKHIVMKNSTSFFVKTIEDKLLDKLQAVYKDAKHYYQDLDEAKFALGFDEAATLIKRQLFDEKLFPEISIDPYGEFIFSHDSDAGYVDIGVRGEKRLSYHVKNDIEPGATEYDNHEWDDNYIIPKDLYSALKYLKQYL